MVKNIRAELDFDDFRDFRALREEKNMTNSMLISFLVDFYRQKKQDLYSENSLSQKPLLGVNMAK